MILHIVKTAAMILAASAACLLCSCDDDENDDIRIATLYDIAEITQKNAGSTVFTVYRPDAESADAVRLTATGFTAGNVDTGTSVFLAYTPHNGQAYSSGEITVERIGVVNNANLKRGNEGNIAGWNEDPVWMISLWPAGEKVCVRLRLPYSTEPRYFALVIDEATADNEYPDAYLFHRRNTIEPNFQREYYGAFNLAELWKMESCRGLRIHVSNSNNPSLNLFTISNPHYRQQE